MRLNLVEDHMKKFAEKIAASDDSGVGEYVKAQCKWLRDMGENLADYELVREVYTDTIGQMKVVYRLEKREEEV